MRDKRYADTLARISATKTPGELVDAITVDDFMFIAVNEVIFRWFMVHATILQMFEFRDIEWMTCTRCGEPWSQHFDKDHQFKDLFLQIHPDPQRLPEASDNDSVTAGK